jgi:hypothetical protein
LIPSTRIGGHFSEVVTRQTFALEHGARRSAAAGKVTAMADNETKKTTDHEEIRRWAEERGGRPATVKDTGGEDEPGVLRIDFPGGEEDRLEEISWDEFFDKFEEKQLAFLYQEQKANGEPSTFNKLVSR